MKVLFEDLGTMEYAECWALQRRLFDEAIEAKRRGERVEQRILIVEHPPVYTLGHSGKEQNLLVGEEFLAERGAKLFHIDRGGDITFHGPGQLVCYPILDLEEAGIGLRGYIEALERTVIETVAEWGIEGKIVADAPGVWVVEPAPMRKICAIGVRSSRFVTMHGFALNVTTDLGWFELINPCGFTDRGVASIAGEVARRGGEVEDAAALMTKVKGLVKTILEKNINVNK